MLGVVAEAEVQQRRRLRRLTFVVVYNGEQEFRPLPLGRPPSRRLLPIRYRASPPLGLPATARVIRPIDLLKFTPNELSSQTPMARTAKPFLAVPDACSVFRCP